MQPYMDLFGRTFPSYSVMAFLGCLAAFGFILWVCPKYRASRNDALYLIAFVLMFTVLGAKLLYQLGHLSELWIYRDIIFASPKSFLDYLGAGFVFYGGLMGGAAGVMVYARFFRQNTVALAESFVPGIPLFHCFGRLGCFMAGCCYGVAWDGPLTVTFTESLAAPNGVGLLPIQLIESGANVINFIVLVVFDIIRRKRYRANGGKLVSEKSVGGKYIYRPLQNLGLYLILYGTQRFVFEFFRGDLIRGVFLGLSTSQWISLFLLPVGIWLMLVKPEKNWLAVRALNGRLPEGQIGTKCGGT